MVEPIPSSTHNLTLVQQSYPVSIYNNGAEWLYALTRPYPHRVCVKWKEWNPDLGNVERTVTLDPGEQIIYRFAGVLDPDTRWDNFSVVEV